MKAVTKNSIKDFMEYYHYFHDSSINKVNYDSKKATVEMVVSVYWSGEPTIKSDGSYDTHRSKIKIIFSGVNEFIDNLEYSSIEDTSVEWYPIKSKELISIIFYFFSSDDTMSILFERIEYEILDY